MLSTEVKPSRSHTSRPPSTWQRRCRPLPVRRQAQLLLQHHVPDTVPQPGGQLRGVDAVLLAPRRPHVDDELVHVDVVSVDKALAAKSFCDVVDAAEEQRGANRVLPPDSGACLGEDLAPRSDGGVEALLPLPLGHDIGVVEDLLPQRGELGGLGVDRGEEGTTISRDGVGNHGIKVRCGFW
jgi:hypothetical protein